MKTLVNAKISGVHGYVPEYRLTNAELETMVDTNDEWIRSRTGIEERRILKGEGKATSDLAVPAVKALLEKTNTDPAEVDLIVVATVTEDMSFPDTANIICDKVGLSKAYGFDLHAACSGFIFALTTAAQFIQTGLHKKVIVVGADMMSAITDYTDRKTCILFGDAGGAVLLEPTYDDDCIIDSNLKCNPEGGKFLYKKAGGSLNPASIENVKAGDHFLFQDGRPVFKYAVNGMIDSINEVMERNNITKDDIDWIVPHQANLRILNSVAKGLDFPIDKVTINIQKYGNTTSATIPLCLWEWENTFKKGDNLILTAFGGGFTFGAIYLKWAY
ncbi:MAG: ketoacyl-ACP synthase III [Bacteroidia bacterium]|nr:ketoacyl-ACP synthase III [Bacteroidia bacterium]